VVDLEPGTNIDGLPASRTTRAGTVEAEQNQVYGILDRTPGEMTQTGSVLRLEP